MRPLLIPGLVALPLLIVAVDVAGVHGSVAHRLSLPLSVILPFLPIAVVAIYFSVGLLLRTRLGPSAWVAGFVLGSTVSLLPIFLLYQFAEVVPVTRWLSLDETNALRDEFNHPYVHCSGLMGAETCFIVRNDHHRERLVAYLRSIHAYREPEAERRQHGP